jgi:hypothetical protein
VPADGKLVQLLCGYCSSSDSGIGRLGNRLFLSLREAAHSYVIGFRDGSSVYPGSEEPVLDRAATDAVFPRAGKFAHASEIVGSQGLYVDGSFIPRRVSSLSSSFYDGHVYNFSTASEWYVASGLSIHNCRCTAYPALGEQDQLSRDQREEDLSDMNKARSRQGLEAIV